MTTPAPAQSPAAPVAAGPEITMLAAPRPPERVPVTPFARPGAVAPAGQTLPDWVLPELDRDTWYASASMITAGLRAAVVRRGSSLYAAHLDRGVTGPLAVPAGVFWIGLDATDTLFAARSDGTLFRARDLGQAQDAAAFEAIVSIPSAVAWDATEGVLVAAGGSFVFSSIDGGNSFRSAALSAGLVAVQIAARPDGVVVAVAHEDGDAGRPSVWISRDRGVTFVRSAFQPRSIDRDGAQIRGREADCVAVLSSDGATWAPEAESDGWRLRQRWEWMLSSQEWASGSAPDRTSSVREPAAPDRPAAPVRVGADGRCPAPSDGDDEGGVGGSIGGLFGMGFGRAFGHTGVLGIAGTEPPDPKPSSTHWGFLADGTCDPANLDDADPASRTCRRDRPLVRAPRVGRIDELELSLHVLDVPAGCVPERLKSVHGTAVLSCARAPGEHALYLAGRDGRWYAEAGIPCAGDLRMFAGRADGTFAFACGYQSDASFALWVREPAPLGTPGAFRTVQIADAIAHRLFDGGQVVAVTTRGKPEPGSLGAMLGALGEDGDGDTPPARPRDKAAQKRARQTFSVVLDQPGAAARTLARDVRVTGDLEAFGTSDGEVFFRIEDAAKKERHVVLRDGKLRDIPASQAPDEIRVPVWPPVPEPVPVGTPGAVGLLSRSQDQTTDAEEPASGLPDVAALDVPAPHSLAADATHLYFADAVAGRIVRVPRAGGAAQVLASGLAVPHAVALDETHVFFTTLGRAYGELGAVASVPKSGGAVTMIAQGQHRPIAVAADADAVYWLVQGVEGSATGALHRHPKNGAPPSRLLDRLVLPRTIGLDATRVYVGHGWGEVVAVPRGGGAPARLAQRGASTPALLVLGDRVLWAAGDEPAIAVAALATGATSIARLEDPAFALAAHGDSLWIADRIVGNVMRVNARSTWPGVVLEALDGPSALFVDETSIYVREAAGTRVRRFSRTGDEPAVLYGR